MDFSAYLYKENVDCKEILLNLHHYQQFNMENQDMMRLGALRYIVDTQYGYVGELITNIGKAFADEFVSLGFVIMGYTMDDKTWRVSELAKRYYSFVS